MPDLRKTRPIRYRLGVAVYWAIWGPAVAVAIPFALIGTATEFCDQRLFPMIADFVQPAWAAIHKAAIRCGNAVLGYTPNQQS